jgi:hypothetical protein
VVEKDKEGMPSSMKSLTDPWEGLLSGLTGVLVGTERVPPGRDEVGGWGAPANVEE